MKYHINARNFSLDEARVFVYNLPDKEMSPYAKSLMIRFLESQEPTNGKDRSKVLEDVFRHALGVTSPNTSAYDWGYLNALWELKQYRAWLTNAKAQQVKHHYDLMIAFAEHQDCSMIHAIDMKYVPQRSGKANAEPGKMPFHAQHRNSPNLGQLEDRDIQRWAINSQRINKLDWSKLNDGLGLEPSDLKNFCDHTYELSKKNEKPYCLRG